MALIEIDHVSKTYGTRDGGVVANDDVTLHVEEGSVFGLFGHNGAGVGALVSIMETRPLSATKHFRLLEILERAK